jgi:peptidoglycan/LPS O-acetylase OafA/YrhL
MKYSIYPYILAIISGFNLPLAGDLEPFPIPLVILCLFVSGALGFFWARESWRWGLWILGLSFTLSLLSITFAGQAEIFFKKDLPIFFIALLSLCLGSLVSAVISNRNAKKNQTRISKPE